MRLSQQADKEIRQALDVLSEDRRIAEFYLHDVFDNEASTAEARLEATKQARQKQINYDKNKTELDPNKIFDPDFSIRNLKRLGAKQVYKKVLYVKIGHQGSKDCKSRKATEEDKTTFSEQWSKFNEQNIKIPDNNQNIHKRQKEIQSYEIRQEHYPAGRNKEKKDNIIEFNYSFEI